MSREVHTYRFHKEDLLEAGLPWECKGGEVLLDRDHGSGGRWHNDVELIFRLPGQHDGTAWRTWYRRPSTEMQSETPWEYEDEVECTLVRLVEVRRREWMPVDVGGRPLERYEANEGSPEKQP